MRLLSRSLRLKAAGVWVSALVLLIGAYGCGYQMRADGRPVGVKIRSLAVPMISSTSSDLAFESDFTRAMREEFMHNARVPIRPTEEAHMVLTGHVRSIRTEAVSFDSDRQLIEGKEYIYSTTSSRRIRVEFDAEMVDRDTGKTVWSEAGLSKERRFSVSDDPLVTEKNQRRALRMIAEDLAERVYLKTLDRF
ncbi:MAG: LPS assembly lipoprotein LptE [Desulfobacteraceae bacterium]